MHDGGECLGDMNISAILPLLNESENCFGGKGGQNVTDVYRFTSKETLLKRLIDGLTDRPTDRPTD